MIGIIKLLGRKAFVILSACAVVAVRPDIEGWIGKGDSEWRKRITEEEDIGR